MVKKLTSRRALGIFYHITFGMILRLSVPAIPVKLALWAARAGGVACEGANSHLSFHHHRSLDIISRVKEGGHPLTKLPAAWEHHIFAICRRRKSNGPPATNSSGVTRVSFVFSWCDILGGHLILCKFSGAGSWVLTLTVKQQQEDKRVNATLGLDTYSQAVVAGNSSWILAPSAKQLD